MSENKDKKVAIACQGGGSHTAFTAGVLRGLMENWRDNQYELVGISGSSGGAFNALAVWYGLVSEDEEKSIELLQSIWNDIAAEEPLDRLTNSWITEYSRLESTGIGLPKLSPYHSPGSTIAKDKIVEILERHIDFEEIPGLCKKDAPELVVGTVNVNEGVFETFTNEDVDTDAVLASAAVPNLFEAVEIHGHYHWDGLFSQNPPIHDLMAVEPEDKPDELWIIQINPQEFEGEPKSLMVISDRRNELSGNISLNQELRFIERVNDWVEQGKLPGNEFKQTNIRHIEMDEKLHCSTKLDRDPDFIEELIQKGENKASEFLA